MRLHRPVQALHGALEVRGVGGQVLHRHVQEIERGGHRPGQEVLAAVHPYLLRQAAERAVGVLAQDRGAQRGQHRLPRRMPRRDRDAGDRVRRAVGEPGDPRPAGLAVDVDQHRGLHVVGLPHLVAPAPRPGQEHIVLARRPLPSRKPGPLPRRQITADRPVQRRNRRRRLPLAPGRASGQLTMDRRDVPLPQAPAGARTSGVTVNRSRDTRARSPGATAADRPARRRPATATPHAPAPPTTSAAVTCRVVSFSSRRRASSRRTAGPRNADREEEGRPPRASAPSPRTPEREAPSPGPAAAPVTAAPSAVRRPAPASGGPLPHGSCRRSRRSGAR